MVLREGAPFPARTSAQQWRRTRIREAGDTNPDVRGEVVRLGYCLFTISASFDELDADLTATGTAGAGGPDDPRE